MNSPRITACICSLDRADWLTTAFRSLLDQKVDKSLVELLIVDNGSTAHDPDQVGRSLVSEAEAQGFVASYVVEPEMGLANARNRALEQANGTWIAFIDDDETADSQWLANIVRVIEAKESSNLACLGGPMRLCWPNAQEPEWYSPELAGYYSGLDLGLEELELDPTKHLLFGGNLVIHREAVAELGGFSITLGRSGHESLLGNEDRLVQLALAERGFNIRYVPDVIVEHIVLPERVEPEWIIRRGYGQGYSDVRLRKILHGHGRIRQALSACRDWFRRYRNLYSSSKNSTAGQLNKGQLTMLRKVHDSRLKGTLKALLFDK